MENSTFHQRFGAHVRALRRAKGLNQEELAEVTGLDQTYISGIERGRRNPTLTVICVLAKGLDMELAELFEGLGSEKS